jgi:hypothetical protein
MLKATSSIVNVNQIIGVLPVVNGGTGVTTSTGSGNTVLSDAPTLSGNVTLSTGNLIVSNSKGIDFSATSGTGTSELLADYEEGTWTVTVTPDAGSLTAYNQGGQYTKVGRLVTLNFYFQITTVGTASGVAKITGLPFSAATASIAAGAASENAVSGVGGVLHVQSFTELYVKMATGATPFAANAYWICTISYFA